MERPYQYVPLVGLIELHEFYKREVESGNFKLQEQLEYINKEIRIRLTPVDDKQITIDEYIRKRKYEKDWSNYICTL